MINRNIEFQTIQILGGEPFLHSDLPHFVNEIKNRYKKHIHLTTNGFWLGKDYSKYDNLFKTINRMFVSIYPTIENAIGREKLINAINEIKCQYNLEIILRDNIQKFIEIKFTSLPHIPTTFCHAQGNCTNLLPSGKLARCGVGAYAHKNPTVTAEFLDSNEDMFYDLTVDDGRDFKIWKEKYPLSSCNFCTMWKEKWTDWKNMKKNV